MGMVVTDLENPFYPYLIGPIHDELQSLGYRMVLIAEGPEEPSLLEQLVNRSIDGVVLTTTTTTAELPHELARRNIPFVFLTRIADGVAGDSSVVDNTLGAALMAGELLQRGHRRIAAIIGPADASTSRERERGFRATLASRGLDLPDELVWRGPFVPETGDAAMEELLALGDPPTAVFCANDSIAIGALNAAHRLGVDVPGHISVVGFDDLPIAAWQLIQLTTVHQPMDAMARTAARLVVERIEGVAGPEEVRREVATPHVVLRRTLGDPR